MVLAYRPENATEFLGRVMKEVTQGNWTGDIPATAHDRQSRRLLHRGPGQDDATLGTKGTADDPIIIVLRVRARPRRAGLGRAGRRTRRGGPSWFVGLGLGTGFGYATGERRGERRRQALARVRWPRRSGTCSGDRLLPEPEPDLIRAAASAALSRAPRISRRRRRIRRTAGSDGVCSAAKNAVAGFAKLTYLIGEGTLRPYVSGAVGGGQIRHVATFPYVTLCGANGKSRVLRHRPSPVRSSWARAAAS